MIETIKKLTNPAFDTYAVFTVQEEVGIRGAQVATQKIKPDFGFGLDTTIAYDVPGAAEHEKITSLGNGVAVKILDGSTICDSRMVNFMQKTADKYKINWQHEILTAGGTDTAKYSKDDTWRLHCWGVFYTYKTHSSSNRNGSQKGCIKLH